LLDFVCGEIESVGKFVNAYCKGNKETKLAWVNLSTMG
jgi:hypothetical protein